MLQCIIGDVNLDHLSKVVTGRILLWKFTIIPFLIDKYFKGENQAMHRSCFCFNFHLLFQQDLAYDGGYYGVIRVIIYFSHLLHIYSLEFFSRNFFSILHRLFNYLFILKKWSRTLQGPPKYKSPSFSPYPSLYKS